MSANTVVSVSPVHSMQHVCPI